MDAVAVTNLVVGDDNQVARRGNLADDGFSIHRVDMDRVGSGGRNRLGDRDKINAIDFSTEFDADGCPFRGGNSDVLSQSIGIGQQRLTAADRTEFRLSTVGVEFQDGVVVGTDRRGLSDRLFRRGSHVDPGPDRRFGVGDRRKLVVEKCQRIGWEKLVAVTGDDDAAIRYGYMFEVVIEELLDNAVRHNDQPTPEVEVTVAETEATDTALIEVADNGPGIPTTTWDVIESGEETPLEHTDGIGLWVVYWAVTALGGTVEYEANEPRGSVIQLRVPLERT